MMLERDISAGNFSQCLCSAQAVINCFAHPATQVQLNFLFFQQPTIFNPQLQLAARLEAQRITCFFWNDDLAALRQRDV